MYILCNQIGTQLTNAVIDIPMMFARLPCQRDIIDIYAENFYSGDLSPPKLQAVLDKISSCYAFENIYKQRIIEASPPYFSADVLNQT